MEKKRGFASDNNAGVHPAVMNKLAMANKGHVLAYGEDELTELTKSLLSGIFGTLNIHFVFGGTAANVLSFASLMGSHEAVICADTAHINVDECGAPERFVGCKLLPIKTGNGKITTDQIKRLCNTVDIPHSVEPKMVSISQPTELGTVYSMKELACISNLVRSRGLFLHVDGARFANAAAYLKIKDLSKFMEHIDVLSFGGTKNGMMFG
ncbi:MAG: beta-eliminating lyase-related protein, partial [Candidatus Paceibacterota bacterium]